MARALALWVGKSKPAPSAEETTSVERRTADRTLMRATMLPRQKRKAPQPHPALGRKRKVGLFERGLDGGARKRFAVARHAAKADALLRTHALGDAERAAERARLGVADSGLEHASMRGGNEPLGRAVPAQLSSHEQEDARRR